jgi:hypothetical protein
MWLFAGQIARGLQRIDTNIHERPATRQCALQTPHAGLNVEPEVGIDHLHCAEFPLAREPNAFQVMGLKPVQGESEFRLGGGGQRAREAGADERRGGSVLRAVTKYNACVRCC